jgi:hypothetical protein
LGDAIRRQPAPEEIAIGGPSPEDWMVESEEAQACILIEENDLVGRVPGM